MLNCRQVSQLVSDSIDKKNLSLWTRIQLWMHLSMCGLCSRFRKTMLRVDEESRAYAVEVEKGTAETDQRLADEARQRISEAIGSDR